VCQVYAFNSILRGFFVACVNTFSYLEKNLQSILRKLQRNKSSQGKSGYERPCLEKALNLVAGAWIPGFSMASPHPHKYYYKPSYLQQASIVVLDLSINSRRKGQNQSSTASILAS
jgi:hypothetical protein